MKGRLRFLCLLTLLLLGTGQALAVEPDERLADPALEARARALGRELRCLVCQNESIDDSRSEFAHDLRRLLRQRLQAGESEDMVRTYIRSRYGDTVLLEPPFAARTWLLWLTPEIVLALGAGAWMLALSRRRKRGVTDKESEPS